MHAASSTGFKMQIYAGAGGDIALKQPTFSNYAMAAHYYGQTRKKFVVFPFDGVSTSPRMPSSAWSHTAQRTLLLDRRRPHQLLLWERIVAMKPRCLVILEFSSMLPASAGG